jgi:hypothetical protein
MHHRGWDFQMLCHGFLTCPYNECSTSTLHRWRLPKKWWLVADCRVSNRGILWGASIPFYDCRFESPLIRELSRISLPQSKRCDWLTEPVICRSGPAPERENNCDGACQCYNNFIPLWADLSRTILTEPMNTVINVMNAPIVMQQSVRRLRFL